MLPAKGPHLFRVFVDIQTGLSYAFFHGPASSSGSSFLGYGKPHPETIAWDPTARALLALALLANGDLEVAAAEAKK